MPTVSVVIPCYNEEKTIRLVLEALSSQNYPLEAMEVIVVDGLSTDHTRAEIAGFQALHPELCIRVIDNPRKIIPAAVNLGIRAAEGRYIARMDAHSLPHSDYISRCIADLEAGKGDNVGGVWEILPGGAGWVARAIAVAAAHPFGVGDAGYRHAAQEGITDTVPFGSFDRALFERIGLFDETLLTNEDYEFNTRLRQKGGFVWLDPGIRSTYYARGDLGSLARQYWRYGFWKQRMLRRYPSSLRWRQALPPLFTASVIGLAFFSLFWLPARILLAGEIMVYLTILFGAGLAAALRRKDAALILGLPLSMTTMHFSWGGGFLWSLVTGQRRQ